MKRIGYFVISAVALATLAFGAHQAFATPPMTGAFITPRVYNDCPSSTLIITNAYPGFIQIDDQNLSCDPGFANRHAWSFSADGGATAYAFRNRDMFTFCATVILEGTASSEGGLRLSPWWSQYNDGTFMLRVDDHGPNSPGEIAVFGGRLPFYSFTGTYGIEYVRGTSALLQIAYDPHDVSATNPATATYTLTYNSVVYTSGPLAFDHGNPAEGHGVWGILDDARAGGFIQGKIVHGVPVNSKGTWTNICFDAGPTPATNSTWGKIKATYH